MARRRFEDYCPKCGELHKVTYAGHPEELAQLTEVEFLCVYNRHGRWYRQTQDVEVQEFTPGWPVRKPEMAAA